jgi:hypothetical protein
MPDVTSEHSWWFAWPALALDEHVRVGISELRMFKIELADGAELPRYTLYDPALADQLVIGHEALCWLVRRGYAAVRGEYPVGTWERERV